ncbi:hypothetical protein BU24DRAFT_188711 [Aaosphaeria arxii CBS 175.79]|uniref:Uncharacterized protein n=1 Tax=Aaosphaeria arxii CBS 175.79 TaxID=1450172 RepID=A0A6A5XRL1_9PLEO|nr:uncharacterized protein BU24DRAFT_188711 [Aaosphaeria arxii CBS 175.79]KAF2015945.1 hypothetical protein BU24DRAFT_188711 [Aaosphaeria arxii CBS 175.79]
MIPSRLVSCCLERESPTTSMANHTNRITFTSYFSAYISALICKNFQEFRGSSEGRSLYRTSFSFSTTCVAGVESLQDFPRNLHNVKGSYIGYCALALIFCSCLFREQLGFKPGLFILFIFFLHFFFCYFSSRLIFCCFLGGLWSRGLVVLLCRG